MTSALATASLIPLHPLNGTVHNGYSSKSSTGTLINGERLSTEGLGREEYQLKSEDIVVRTPYNFFITEDPFLIRFG
jgi:hypothetical protein